MTVPKAPIKKTSLVHKPVATYHSVNISFRNHKGCCNFYDRYKSYNKKII